MIIIKKDGEKDIIKVYNICLGYVTITNILRYHMYIDPLKIPILSFFSLNSVTKSYIKFGHLDLLF